MRSYFVEQFSLHFIASHYLDITKKRKRMTFASDTKSNKIQLKRKIKIKKKDNVSKNQNKTDPDRLLHVDVAWDLFIRKKRSYIK